MESAPRADAEHNAFMEGFVGIRLQELAAMSDAELAITQANSQPGTPKYILTEKEWERRIAGRAAKEARVTALQTAMVGIAGSLLGAATTYLLQKYF